MPALYPDPAGEFLEYVSEDFALTHRILDAGGKAYLLPKLACEHYGEFCFKPMHAWPQEDNTKPHFIQPKYVSAKPPEPTETPNDPVTAVPV